MNGGLTIDEEDYRPQPFALLFNIQQENNALLEEDRAIDEKLSRHDHYEQARAGHDYLPWRSDQRVQVMITCLGEVIRECHRAHIIRSHTIVLVLMCIWLRCNILGSREAIRWTPCHFEEIAHFLSTEPA